MKDLYSSQIMIFFDDQRMVQHTDLFHKCDDGACNKISVCLYA